MRRRPNSTLLLVLLALALGAALRLWFIRAYPQINGDALIYGDIAGNWLKHEIYGRLGDASGARVAPTLIRLPGYPFFLAVCFGVFGLGRYTPVLYIQAAIDLLSCLLVFATAGRAGGPRLALAALYLACLCPFTANYVAMPLAETLSIFCVALGLFALTELCRQPGWIAVALLAFSWSYAALLRPDGALLGAASLLALALFGNRNAGRRAPARRGLLRHAILASLFAALPFAAWTVRNWRTFHVFEPFAPRYATDPGEFTMPGFQRWMRTWIVEFVSTSDIYWSANTDQMDFDSLPRRAFDSPGQRRDTQRLFADYNRTLSITPDLDARFAALARERARAHPLRTYIALPLLRILDMWLRPRTEGLNVELRWWEWSRHHAETAFAAAYAALNLLYILAACAGLARWPRGNAVLLATMLAYIVLRSLMLGSMEGPEPRYTLECFPMLFVLGGAALAPRRTGSPGPAPRGGGAV